MITTILSVLLLAIVALLALSIYRTRRVAAEAVHLVPQAGEIVPVAGGTIHYVDLGPKDAQTLVMIHGLSGQLQHFTYALAGLLAQRFRVIVVDRPGCGYSTRESDALAAPSEQGRMIGEALDRLGVERPVLVGHSLGGAVSLAMAMDRPDRVGALALLCPATQHEDVVPEVFKGLLVKSPAVRRLIGATIAVPMAAATKDRVLGIVYHPETPSEDFMIGAGGALGLRPEAFVTASSDVVALRDVGKTQSARYEDELRVPGGILFGASDVILSPAVHGHTMQAHGLEFEMLEGRGHMIPLTAPQDCAEFISRMAGKVG
ncbi:alpha/beta fold hydrolase [Sedimentitalea todarodis]|uniref:Alpha/beta fold hydrolase n=1 Tax=Sedimentitalea todarodis TaxID=1631240 RepID=A0ABU3V9S3_9RHOB|nr:alpha/beta fold hydrolase [Sedimentitalea todarodis]MDU9002918.1 alpha/beta fold hydrolase [Sedimentitalea todarodis]